MQPPGRHASTNPNHLLHPRKPQHQVVNPHPQLGGQKPIGRVQQPGRACIRGFVLPVRQHGHQITPLQRRARSKAGQAGNAQVAQSRLQPHLTVVGHIAATHGHGGCFTRALKPPVPVALVLAQGDAGVLLQIARVLGVAALRQVLGAGADAVVQAGQRPPCQAGGAGCRSRAGPGRWIPRTGPPCGR